MTTLRRLAWLGFVLAVVMVVAPGAWAQGVRIGVVQGLSGPPAITDFGQSYLQGIKLAVKEYNARGGYRGKPVELVVYDDEANPQRAVELVTRLITQDRVPVVIGTVNSGNVLAFMHLNQQHKIPLMAGPAIASPITTKYKNEAKNYIFRCSMVEEFQVNVLLDWGVKKFQRIGLIHSTTGYGMFAKDAILKGLEQRGVKPVVVESTNPGATDLTPQLLKMKQADVQLLYTFAEEWEKQYRALSKISYRPVMAGNWGLSSGMLRDVVGAEALEGTVMAQALDLNDPKARQFDEKARKEYGREYRWPVVVTLGYDAANLVLKAIDAGGPTAEAIRDALEKIDDFDAVTTGIPKKPYAKDDHECLDQKDVFLGVWKGGRVVKIE
jgi:branched-chain amino acid transport system substrate-binding protein